MGEITFKLERDNRPLIEDFDKKSMGEKFFHRQYAKAIKLIARHLDEEKHALPEVEFEKYTDRNNNLFAFVGDRGTGKTSCMLSVANSLVNKMENAFEQQVLNETEFFTIGLLDPSYFDSYHDILMLFVAKLYSLFEDKARKIDPETDNYKLKTKLLKDFSATQKHIHSLLQSIDKQEGDEFERLTSYAVAMDLKGDIYRLIDDYRTFIDKPKAVMLLMVDDIDLNTSEASRMAELLRKYFVQSHTIVMLSVKLDQLSYIKKHELTKQFYEIVGMNIEYPEIDEMAERYLSKFMPQEHRIFLPTPELYFDDELTIEIGGKKKKFCSVKQSIPELIYRKTRYLFYNFDGEASYIVPRNLRDLRQLLKVLAEMEGDLETFDPNMPLDMKERNRKVFQNYLYEDWVVNNLDNNSAKQIRYILAADGANQLNNAIVQVLKTKFIEELNYTGIDEVDSVLSKDNKNYNISFGDVMGLLVILSNELVSKDDKRFLFIINAILSMKLYEYETEIGDPAQSRHVQEVAPKRYKDDSLNYFKFVGGRFINSGLMELLPRKEEKSLSRSLRKISRSSVNAIIEKIINRDVKDFRALELLILCIFRTTSTRADLGFRSESKVAYADFQGGSDFVFEIGSLFNNIRDKENCYARFAKMGENYKNIVDSITAVGEGKSTLYHHLTAEVCQRMSFRSTDLLQYFMSVLGNTHYESVESPFKVMMTFLEGVKNFEFQTYKPVNEENDALGMTTVKFDCLNEVFDFADDVTLQEQFDALFGDEKDDERSQSGTEDNTPRPAVVENEEPEPLQPVVEPATLPRETGIDAEGNTENAVAAVEQ